MTLLRATFVAVLALALLLAVPTAASAKFTRTASATLTASTDTLVPPTSVKVSCNQGVGLRIRWTATTDLYATGYTIIGTYGGITSSVDVSGRTTTSYNYPIAVPNGTTIQLVSVFKNWTSARTTAIAVNC